MFIKLLSNESIKVQKVTVNSPVSCFLPGWQVSQMARRQIQLEWKMKSEAPGSSLKLSSHTLSSEKPSPISIRLATAPELLSHHLAHNIQVCVIHVWHIMCVKS